uniref:Uncharacterized protein n=1 Tax=Anopheles quadriannulatus TaxID=34691 RepID=A0A182XRB0_ANOQN
MCFSSFHSVYLSMNNVSAPMSRVMW